MIRRILPLLILHPFQLHRRHRDSGSFKPSAFRQEAASLSEGENMFAFQYSNIADTNKSIIHFEFMGCIAENETQEADIEVDSRVKRGKERKKLISEEIY